MIADANFLFHSGHGSFSITGWGWVFTVLVGYIVFKWLHGES